MATQLGFADDYFPMTENPYRSPYSESRTPVRNWIALGTTISLAHLSLSLALFITVFIARLYRSENGIDEKLWWEGPADIGLGILTAPQLADDSVLWRNLLLPCKSAIWGFGTAWIAKKVRKDVTLVDSCELPQAESTNRVAPLWRRVTGTLLCLLGASFTLLTARAVNEYSLKVYQGSQKPTFDSVAVLAVMLTIPALLLWIGWRIRQGAPKQIARPRATH